MGGDWGLRIKAHANAGSPGEGQQRISLLFYIADEQVRPQVACSQRSLLVASSLLHMLLGVTTWHVWGSGSPTRSAARARRDSLGPECRARHRQQRSRGEVGSAPSRLCARCSPGADAGTTGALPHARIAMQGVPGVVFCSAADNTILQWARHMLRRQLTGSFCVVVVIRPERRQAEVSGRRHQALSEPDGAGARGLV